MSASKVKYFSNDTGYGSQSLAGGLAASLADLEQKINVWLAEKPGRSIVSMTMTTYPDSNVLGVLVAYAEG